VSIVRIEPAATSLGTSDPSAELRHWRAEFSRLDITGVTDRIDEVELAYLTYGFKRRGFTPEQALRRGLPLLRTWCLRRQMLPALVLFCVFAGAAVSDACLGGTTWRAFSVPATGAGTYAALLWRAQRRLLKLAGLTPQEFKAS
jgi:hypothetical protein